jgi:CubicO group peptidase (beta-lactamase class C family)
MGRDTGLSFVSSADEVGLASQLAQIAAQMRIANVSVGLTGGGRRLFASIDPEGKCVDRQVAQDGLIHAGCLAKPLTATLVAEAVAEARLGWHDEIATALNDAVRTTTPLVGVTLQQLLDHTHGLDGSSLKHVPRTAEGRIDVGELCEALSPRRLSTPGDLYSYSDTGAWFAGAVLEQTYRRTYLELLLEKRIVPNAGAATATDICPATGGSLRLAAWEWLEFLETHSVQIATLAAREVPLPGWGLFERAACCGWKCYPGGWLGHNSNDSAGSAVLRFHPREGVGIIAAAAQEGAAMMVLAGLLGQVFPELFIFRMPRPLAQFDVGAWQLSRYSGDYSRSDTRLEVTGGGAGALSLTIHEVCTLGISPARQFRAGKDHLFVPESRDDPAVPFVHFLRPDAAGRFEYVWNGRQLWRRQ